LCDPDSYDAYLPKVLSPLRPLLFIGRSAAAYPEMPSRDTISVWWRDPRGVLVGQA